MGNSEQARRSDSDPSEQPRTRDIRAGRLGFDERRDWFDPLRWSGNRKITRPAFAVETGRTEQNILGHSGVGGRLAYNPIYKRYEKPFPSLNSRERKAIQNRIGTTPEKSYEDFLHFLLYG